MAERRDEECGATGAGLARALGAWRAATWGERLELAREAGPDQLSHGDERAREPEEAWARAFSAGDVVALARRARWDGISLASAATLLADGVCHQERAPDWLAEGVAWRFLSAESGIDLESEEGRATLLKSWSTAARALLLERCATARALSEDTLGTALAPLDLDLERLTDRALAAFGGAARAPAGPQPSRTPLSFYTRFPILLRQSERLVATFVDAVTELLDRWVEDREALGATLGAPNSGSADEIVALERLDSDRHAGGRQVLRLRFAGGLTVVYKPRPLAAEAAWAAFVETCRAAGLGDEAPAVAGVLERDGYGWMESVEPGDPGGEAAMALWFRRAGATVALADLLGAEDLHRENLIATARGPVAVDLELILQPARREVDLERGSPLATGLLAPSGQAATSDRVARHAAFAAGGVLPRRRGREAVIAEHRDALSAGYAHAYRVLLERRDDLLAAGGPLDRLAAVGVRVLFRPSALYGRALESLTSPRAQSEPIVAPLLLERGLADFAFELERPRLWPLVAPERAALERLDVPRFEAIAGRRAVHCDGCEVDELFLASGIDRLRRRFALWHDDDLARQLGALRELLATEEERLEPRWRELASAPHSSVESRGVAVPRSGGVALGLARQLAARRLAQRSDLGVEQEADSATEVRRLSLYDGLAGEALALTALAQNAHEAALAEAARRARAELAARLARFEPSAAPIGGFQGIGSLVWTLVWIDRLGGGEIDPLLLAARLAAALDPTRLAADRRLDVEGGCAGAILALLSLAETGSGAGALERARQAGKRLVAAAEPEGSGFAWRGELGRPLAGFAHGASGIARALAALAAATGDREFAAAASGALRFERSLYDPERRNWPVLLAGDRPQEPRRRWMTAWCHGAAGIALARALLLAAGSAETGVEADLELALAATCDVAEPGDDHLCCGAAGRASILAYVGSALGQPAELAAAQGVFDGIVARAATNGGLLLPRPRDPASGAAWGLLRGRAGVAWAAAELAGAPLPSPLALELPSERVRRVG